MAAAGLSRTRPVAVSARPRRNSDRPVDMADYCVARPGRGLDPAESGQSVSELEERIVGCTSGGRGVTVSARPGRPEPDRHAEPPAEGSGADRDNPEWLGEPETVLLVEDDAGDALLVEELLADSGVQASLTWVRSLAEAKDVAARTPGAGLHPARPAPARRAGDRRGHPDAGRGAERSGGGADRAGRGERRAGRGRGRCPGLPDQGPGPAGCVRPRHPVRRAAQAGRAGVGGLAGQRAARGGERAAGAGPAAHPADPHRRARGGHPVPPGPGARAARRRLLRRGGDLRRHRARGHRRCLRAWGGRGSARCLPAGRLAFPGPGRRRARWP